MKAKQAITTCLWFEQQAEQAAEFYVSVFADSKICRKLFNQAYRGQQ